MFLYKLYDPVWNHVLERSALQEQRKFIATLAQHRRKDPLGNGREVHLLYSLPHSCRAHGVLHNVSHDVQVVAVLVQDTVLQIQSFTLFGCLRR